MPPTQTSVYPFSFASPKSACSGSRTTRNAFQIFLGKPKTLCIQTVTKRPVTTGLVPRIPSGDPVVSLLQIHKAHAGQNSKSTWALNSPSRFLGSPDDTTQRPQDSWIICTAVWCIHNNHRQKLLPSNSKMHGCNSLIHQREFQVSISTPTWHLSPGTNPESSPSPGPWFKG